MEPTSPQDRPTPETGRSVHDTDAAVLASEFKSLPADYQSVVHLAQQQHGIRVVPLQELRGGFTGAALYLVSVSSAGSSRVEHLVLKLDRPWSGEPDELQRHSKALELASPDFAREHMAEVAFDRVELDGCIAIFYRIAGETLEGYRPLGAFQQQRHLEAMFGAVSRGVLIRWNAEVAGFDQGGTPSEPSGSLADLSAQTARTYREVSRGGLRDQRRTSTASWYRAESIPTPCSVPAKRAGVDRRDRSTRSSAFSTGT